MVLYRHGLYAIGARLDANDADLATSPLAMFAIERFSEAEHQRGREFSLPPTFNIRDVLHGTFGPHLVDDDGESDRVRRRLISVSQAAMTWL